MAAGGTAEVLGEISERHLECSICLNRFTEPKLLNCIHSFCKECLQGLTEGMKLKCPLCRCETTLGKDGVGGLPTNFTLSALVEEFAIQEQLLQGQGSKIKCQSCNKQNEAISFCTDCANFLCKDCQGAHESMAIMKSHKTYTMAQLQSGEIVYRSKHRQDPKCKKHPDQNLNIYCNTCEQLLCTTCSILKHGNHSCVDLPEAYDECKQEIEELKRKAEEKTATFNSVKKTIDKSREKMDIMFAATNDKISTKADQVVARIREREKKLKRELEKIYEDRVKTFQTIHDTNSKKLKEAEQTLNEVNQLMAEEIQSEILDLKPQLLDNLKELTEKESENVPDNLHYLDFQGGDEKSLGRLVTQTKQHQYKGKEKHPPRIDSVAVFSNNEIVTVDRENKLLICYPPTSNSQISTTSHELLMPNLTDPSCIAVNNDDHLILLDGSAVKTFSRDYQLLHQFTPGRGSDEPTCLAVDDSNLIAVGYAGKEEISLHNPDGSLIRRLPVPMPADELVISKKHLIYINSIQDKMVSLDFNGRMVFNVDCENPTSLCCDSHGNIHVFACINKRTENSMHWIWFSSLFAGSYIHHFSTDGKHIGRVILETSNAHCMTFTPAGDLVLATANNTLKICQHV